MFPSATDLAKAAALRLQHKLQKLSSRPRVRVLLTGGTLGIQLLQELSELDLDTSRVSFYFGDERFVSLGDKDRNEAQGLAVWPELAHSLHRFPDTDLSLSEAQVYMNTQLEQDLGPVDGPVTTFDLVVLGMGPDGHVASLFPGRNH